MLEDIVKDRAFAITSYCDTSEKLNVLNQNIKIIRDKFPNFKIALQANYPLSEDVQKSVDMYFYQDLNFTGNDKWIYYWNVIMDTKTDKPYFNKKFYYSILDTGFSVFQQIKALTKYLIDYQWVMLVNYDASIEEIRIEDYKSNYDLTLHLFPEGYAYSLIIMFFNPQVFFDKVAKYFTYENWMKSSRIDQLNEQRFYDMVNESDINHFDHAYKITDKISNMPDYLYFDGTSGNKPNAPINDFFKCYLLYQSDGKLEIYLWDLSENISTITFNTDQEWGVSHVIVNENSMGAFEHVMSYEGNQINTITISEINNIYVNIELRIKKGYSTRPI